MTIVLDPGLAFGTGSHPTTHMCLQWLGENLRPGERVIDYGCGSGILAIAAALLGAARVVAVDIDPQAVTSTRANAQVNGVDVDVRLSTEPVPEPADVVVANILSNPLKLLAPMLSSLVAPGGRLVLAGLLDRQMDEVAAAYPDIDAGRLRGSAKAGLAWPAPSDMITGRWRSQRPARNARPASGWSRTS